jgi:hypothetical protein
MRAILATLAVAHLLGLVSFFSLPFAFDKPRNLYAEALEVEFWVFPAVFALLWALSSLLILLRHRRLHQPGQARALRVLSIGICAALLLIAIGAARLAAPATPLFQVFGADLPAPTLLFIQDHWAFYLLPAGAAVAAAVVLFSPDSAGQAARFASGSLIGLLVLGNASLYLGLVSLFLPFFGCGFERPDTGFTRLHAAAMLGRKDSALRHITEGTDVNVEDKQGLRPLDLALDSTSETARLLVERGGVRSTKESRQRKVEGVRAQASRDASFGGCSV